MKSIGPGKILGLALSQTSASLAELAPNGGGQRKITHAAEFAYPAGVTLDQPAELGAALRNFLRTKGFSAREVVIGLPAKWILSRRKELPPATPEVAAASLRLQAETDFSSDPAALALDFAGQPNAREPSTVLLMATARTYIDNTLALAKAAGLKVRTITATTAALAQASGPEAADAMVLAVSPGSAELLLQHAGAPTHLRHLSVSESSTPAAPLASEVRRALAGLPRNGTRQALLLWDTAGRATDLAPALAQRLAMPVTAPDPGKLAHATTSVAGLAPAVALAALPPGAAPVDFLRSRLAPPKPKTNARPIAWAAALGVAILIAIVVAYLDMHQQQTQLADLKGRLAGWGDQIHQAQTAADRLATARVWTSNSPHITACLRDLTNLFPDDGSIWATSLSLHADNTGQLIGKAVSKEPALALQDRLKDSPRFASVHLQEVRDAGRTGGEFAFSITFRLRPESPATNPAASTSPSTSTAPATSPTYRANPYGRGSSRRRSAGGT